MSQTKRSDKRVMQMVAKRAHRGCWGLLLLIFSLPAPQCFAQADASGNVWPAELRPLVERAIEIVNLTGTFKPDEAEKQFTKARTYLSEPLRQEFDKNMMGRELTAIKETHRAQEMKPEVEKVEVHEIKRATGASSIGVQIPVIRKKQIGNKALPEEEFVYFITFKKPASTSSDKAGLVENIRLERLPDTNRNAEEVSFKGPAEEQARQLTQLSEDVLKNKEQVLSILESLTDRIDQLSKENETLDKAVKSGQSRMDAVEHFLEGQGFKQAEK